MKIKSLRDNLLLDGKIKEYKDFLEFLKNPSLSISSDTKNYIYNNGYIDLIDKIINLYNYEPEKFRSIISWGQVVIWDYVLISYEKIKKCSETLDSLDITFYENNYLKACEEVKKVLSYYSEAKTSITELEKNLGVDRYLDDVVSEEFDVLKELFDSVHKKTDNILKGYKDLFTNKWDNGNICELILHQLVRPNMDNQVCTLVNSNKNKVFLFVIDGLGMGQYLWSKHTVPINTNFAYSENIFKWLSENNLSDEYVLGAPLVSDTAAGLSQIFTGKTAKETRIFSSTVKKQTGSSYVPVKNESPTMFAEIVNLDVNSFTVDISSQNKKMKIYYCSKYDFDHISGFSKFIFDSSEVISVTPSERVFSYLGEETSEDFLGLVVTYITNIDNSGHVMGSFSQFERYEHEKINSLVKNYLISLAKNFPNVFDGHTSIMITADHGMTESYRINITRKAIIDTLNSVGLYAGKLIVANRALFIYDVKNEKIEDYKETLANYFTSKNIDALVISKGDDKFDKYFPDYDDKYIDTTPDIAIMLISEGVFCNREIEKKLMHFGGHGGYSIDEVFVPAINIELNEKLLTKIDERFLRQVI